MNHKKTKEKKDISIFFLTVLNDQVHGKQKKNKNIINL